MKQVPVPPLCGETTFFILHLFRFIRLKDKSIYRSIAGDLYWSYLALKENSSQLNNCYNSIHCNFLFVNN